MAQSHVPGLLVLIPGSQRPHISVRRALAAVGLSEATISATAAYVLATWGLNGVAPAVGQPLLLSRTNWHGGARVDPATLGGWLADLSIDRLHQMLPPFAALGLTGRTLVLASDPMGFRQLYSTEKDGWFAVSSSARLLAALAGSGLDEDAVLLQSQLGWQLGQRTLFAGVAKMPPGALVELSDGKPRRIVLDPAPQPVGLNEGVDRAATVLRESLGRYLDENPDPTLQLTGGQDSRLILSAVPPERRRGLRVMTLGVPGTDDVELAAQLSSELGLRHIVRTLDDLSSLSPLEAFERTWAASSRLDCMSDPLARAATLWVEQSFPQGARLSGLGGEIARGFYYTGRVSPTPITDDRVERLAAWRMLANEAVEPGALNERIAGQAIPLATEAIHRAISDSGPEWYTATDELYYRHRMQRWAGLGETAICFDRSIANPMLDHRFIEVARGLAPKDKKNSRFLALLQMSLDPALASIRLDNRPAPRAYANPNLLNRARQRAAMGRSAAHKIRQRLRGERRPPPGGAVMATKVVDFLRQEPQVMDPIRDLGIMSESWLDGVAAGRMEPTPASLAFCINLLVAVDRRFDSRSI